MSAKHTPGKMAAYPPDAPPGMFWVAVDSKRRPIHITDSLALAGATLALNPGGSIRLDPRDAHVVPADADRRAGVV